MGGKTEISWTDFTWNPLRGCSRVSAGCANCYAATIAARFSYKGAPYQGLAFRSSHGAEWTGIVSLVESALDLPLDWRKPRRIFVNSMSDLFHERVTDDWIDTIFAVMWACGRHTFQVLTKRPERMRDYCDKLLRHDDRAGFFVDALERHGLGAHVADPISHSQDEPLPNVHLGVSVEDQMTADQIFAVMALAPQHTFQVLTKRPERMRAYLSKATVRHHVCAGDGCPYCSDTGRTAWAVTPYPNVWLGVSVEDQPTADARIPLLLQTPAAVRFVSYEPALGPVAFGTINGRTSRVHDSGRMDVLRGLAVYPTTHPEYPEQGYPIQPLDWLIIGGESGPHARPCDLAWIRSAVAQCRAAGVPVFVKQDSGPRAGQQGRIPDDLWIKECPP